MPFQSRLDPDREAWYLELRAFVILWRSPFRRKMNRARHKNQNGWKTCLIFSDEEFLQKRDSGFESSKCFQWNRAGPIKNWYLIASLSLVPSKTSICSRLYNHKKQLMLKATSPSIGFILFFNFSWAVDLSH